MWAFSAGGNAAPSGCVAMFGGRCGCPSREQRSYWHLVGGGQGLPSTLVHRSALRDAGSRPEISRWRLRSRNSTAG